MSETKDVETGETEADASNDDDFNTNADPFTYREGKTFAWRNVNMKLLPKKDEGDRMLLDAVWGEVPPRETTAIMGPSGAGKTSLLNILSGRAKSHGRIVIESDVRFNNYQVDPTKIAVRKQIAYVSQEDSLQVTATPREAIYFSAKLRLPRATSEEQLKRLTTRMITELGLVSCADTMIGGELIKGISGGERKRTSVGVELVVKPTMLFLDEPTSGLDSFSAVQLCQVLKKVANAGASVLFTIHQPSSEIFNSFDHLILMNKGRVMYQGAVQDVPDFFGSRGHPNPPNYNPADWVMYVAQAVSVEDLDQAGFFPTDERVMDEPSQPEEGKDSLGVSVQRRSLFKVQDAPHTSPPGFMIQTKLQFFREMTNLVRDTVALKARFALTIFLSLLVGVIFYKVADEPVDQPQNLQSHFGALTIVAFMSMLGTAMPSLLAFPQSRPVFLREYSTNHYSVVSYFLSRLAMEAILTGCQILVMVIITHSLIDFKSGFGIFFATVYSLAMASTALAVLVGCALEDPKLGVEMLPPLFVPQFLFAGFFVAPDLIPPVLRWAQYLCTLTYGIRILLIAEFSYCYVDNGAGPCETLLSNVGANPDDRWWYWLVLVGLFIGFRVAGVLVLRAKATKFYS